MKGGGGALTAGILLEEFVAKTPWAHLDIAGPASKDKASAYTPQGADGFGVRTLCEYLITNFCF